LFAEDNPDDRFFMRRAMRDYQDVEMEIALDGKEALDALVAFAPIVPVLIILDVNMPKLSGLEALRLIRARDGMAMLPIVIFSSSDEPRDIAEAERCQATEYVLKPFDADEYVKTVQRLMRRYVGI